jgi:hypothetical protein
MFDLSAATAQRATRGQTMTKRSGADGDQPMGGEPPECKATDTLSRKGGMALARRLQQYWHDERYPAARFWAEPIDERFTKVGTYDLYRVVSNLVNALPPRYREDTDQD